MTKLLMIFPLCVLMNCGLYAQDHIVNYKPDSTYEIYRGRIRTALAKLKEVKTRTVSIQGINNEDIDASAGFFIYPLRRIDISFKNSEDRPPVVTCHEPESLIVIQQPQKQVYEFTINNNTLAKGINGRFSSIYLNLSNQITSKGLSFFYFLNADRYRRNGAMVQIKNQEFYYSDGLRNYEQIKNYLISECGSIENYVMASENEKLLLTLKANAFKNFNPSEEKDVRGFIQNDWRYHAMCFPKDTTGNIALIINNIAQAEHISSNQRNNIQTGLEHLLRGKQLKTLTSVDTNYDRDLLSRFSTVTSGKKSTAFAPSDPYGQITFMSVDIKPLLYSILHEKKAKAYFNYYLMEQYRFRQVDIHIDALVSKQKYLSNGAKAKAYSDYIISAIQDSGRK